MLTVLPTEAWIPQRRIHNHAFTTGPLASQPQQQDDHVTGEQELGERYLLTSEQHTSSGKSTIYTGYRKCDQTGQPAGDAVAIKVSDNTDALTREIQNFQIVGDEFFVETHEYMEPADDVECDILHEGNGALVMELGAQDLKGYLDQNGPLQGEELRSVAGRCVECIETLHNNGMVWTEMKSENFILQECGTIKGIDLESAGTYLPFLRIASHWKWIVSPQEILICPVSKNTQSQSAKTPSTTVPKHAHRSLR